MPEYVYQPTRVADYASGTAALARRIPNPIRQGPVHANSSHVITELKEHLASLGIIVRPIRVDKDLYLRYFDEAQYTTRYPEYYKGNLVEKSFEHFVTLSLLYPASGTVFIDVASEQSPLAEIAARLYDCRAYSQDIMYPAGIIGNRIGGDACSMPVQDGFATFASITCSLEHFEGDGDTRLFRELARVIQPGGRVVAIPCYLYNEPAIQTDPTISAGVAIPFDAEATVYCAEGWGNRHGRFYSPETLLARIITPTPEFRFTVFALEGYEQIPGRVYARWVLLAERVN